MGRRRKVVRHAKDCAGQCEWCINQRNDGQVARIVRLPDGFGLDRRQAPGILHLRDSENMLHLRITLGAVVVQVDQERPVVIVQIRVRGYERFHPCENGLVPTQHGVERDDFIQDAFGFLRLESERSGNRLALESRADVVEKVCALGRSDLEGRSHDIEHCIVGRVEQAVARHYVPVPAKVVKRVWAHGARATGAVVVRVFAAGTAHLDEVEVAALVA